MTTPYDVIVAGDYCLDLIFTGLPKLPELGVEIVSTGFEMLPGASFNTAACLHRLGLLVGWAGDFGDDDFSRFVLERAAAEGLDASLFVHHKRPLRNITVAASYPQDRAFIAFYDPPARIPAAMKALPKVSARCMYIPGVYSGAEMEAGMVLIHAKRMKVIMDGNSTEDTTLTRPAVRKAIGAVDLFMPNALEVRRLTGLQDLEAGMRSLGKLTPLLVVKDGAQGAYAVRGEEILHCPGMTVEAMDTTGAGDAFNAGFIKAWLMDLPLQDCLQWGNVVGGLSTLAAGGAGRVTREEDVRRVIRQGMRL